MSDVVFTVLTLVVFVLFALLVGLLDRLLGTDPDSQAVRAAVASEPSTPASTPGPDRAAAGRVS